MSEDDNKGEDHAQEKRQQIDALLMEFRRAQSPQQEAWQLQQSKIPRRLYHYTTRSGLLGITSGNSLWASDAR